MEVRKKIEGSLLYSIVIAMLMFISVLGLKLPQIFENRATVANVNLFLSPSSKTCAVGDTFPILVTLNTDVDTVSAVALNISYNPTLLQYISATTGPNFPVKLKPEAAANGNFTVTLGVQPTTPFHGVAGIETLQFKSLTVGSSTITINTSSITASIGKPANTLITILNSQVNCTAPPTITLIKSPTPVRTLTPTRTPTKTPSPTRTPTKTPSPTRTPTPGINISVTPTRTPSPTKTPTTTPTVTKSPTPYPVCTPVICQSPGSLNCPVGQICLGGCGYVCMSPTPTPSITPAPITSTPSPTLTLSPAPTGTVKPGDADGNGVVDGIDYVIWRNHYNQHFTGSTYGDFDNNGIVDGIDYVIWRNHYGT